MKSIPALIRVSLAALLFFSAPVITGVPSAPTSLTGLTLYLTIPDGIYTITFTATTFNSIEEGLTTSGIYTYTRDSDTRARAVLTTTAPAGEDGVDSITFTFTTATTGTFVDNYDYGDGDAGTATGTFVFSGAGPTVTTGAATSITASAAALQASINPNNILTTAQFQYGLTTSYGSTAAITLSPGNGSTSQNVSAAISGLTPNTTYHFRAVATNSVGGAAGNDQTFTTLALPPAITIPPPSQTIKAGQNLSFTVTANDPSASFQWRKDGTNLNGATSPILSLGLARPHLSGNYTVVVSNSSGSVTSAPPAALTVNAASPGSVIAWGNNGNGQADVPVGLKNVTAVVAGGANTAAVKSDGSVVVWGYGGSGLLNVPAGLSGVTAITGGSGVHHILALRTDGTVVAWGFNDFGQVNGTPTTNSPFSATANPVVLNGQTLSGVTAVAVGQWHSVALKNDGTVLVWGRSDLGISAVPSGLTGVTAVAAGAAHTLALKSDGTVRAWGSEGFGATTVPAGLNGVKAIAAGSYHNVALKNDGTVAAWSYNYDGQTTGTPGASAFANPVVLNGQILNGVTAIAAGSSHTVALKNDGTLVAWGAGKTNSNVYPEYGQSIIPPGLSGVTSIASGSFHNAAIVVVPALTILSSGPTLSLLWPDAVTGYRLESALNLSPPLTWSNLTGPLQTNAGSITLTLPAPAANRYYRLAKP